MGDGILLTLVTRVTNFDGLRTTVEHRGEDTTLTRFISSFPVRGALIRFEVTIVR